MPDIEKNIKSIEHIFDCYENANPKEAQEELDKMYSSKLRKDFCWSRPKYYTVPISDSSKNNVDRKIIFDFIVKIRNAFNTYNFAEPLREYLQDLECVCVCVYQMMLSSASVIEIICKKDDNTEKEQLWLHNNNYIHCCKVLEMDDNSVSHLKDICKKNGVPLEMLWDMPIGDDEWIKKHICDVKTPIVVRMNSVSIYSDKEKKECDYFHIGFDEKKLEAGLR